MNLTNILEIWAPGGFICGRHMAGLAYQSGLEAMEDWNLRKEEYESRDQYASFGTYEGQEKPYPGWRAFFAFLGGFVSWPFIYGGWGATIAVESTPKRVWSGIHWVFVKRPPKRLRKEQRLAALQEKSAKLEKELEL